MLFAIIFKNYVCLSALNKVAGLYGEIVLKRMSYQGCFFGNIEDVCKFLLK